MIIAIISSFCAYANFNISWSGFLKHPDEVSLANVEESIITSVKQCGWGKNVNKAVISIDVGQKLFKYIKEGNEFAFKVGLIVVPCLDGGELEDFYRSAARFFEINPIKLLALIKQQEITDEEYERIIVMLQEESTDNKKLSILIIEKRIEMLSEINQPKFDNLIKLGLKMLREILSQIK